MDHRRDLNNSMHSKIEVIWNGKELDWIDPGKCREHLRGVGLRYL